MTDEASAAPRASDAPRDGDAPRTHESSATAAAASNPEARLPPADPSVAMRERLWPSHRGKRIALVAAVAGVIGYIIWVQALRYAGMWNPYAADGDQPQAVWQYWRYHLDGAFPPGDFVVDYAFVMHAPPVWWALMAGLSTVFEPLIAAKLLNIVAYVLTVVALWFTVSRRSNAFIGLAAVVLMVRNWDFSYIIAGGYARSFGPFLTILFLHAFLEQRHRLALVVLVLQAAFYPSVVIPCGLAYGAYTVLKGPMSLRLRRMAGMTVAGILIIGFGKFQDLRGKDWWGPVVTLEEAKTMAAWGPGGRVVEVPLRPLRVEVPKHFKRAFRQSGHILMPDQGQALLERGWLLAALLFVPLGVYGVVLAVRRRQQRAWVDVFPWQVGALALAAMASYLLARTFAFKLYVPYRPLQHVWPYMIHIGIALLAWSAVRNLLGAGARSTALACGLAVVPSVVLFGDGAELEPRTYASTRHLEPLYKAVQKLPLDAVIAGEFQYVDKTPLFAFHRSYIMKNMAHPFRRGYWDEAERRIFRMYSAMYATDMADVVAFAREENVRYLILGDKTLQTFDGRLFEPLRRQLSPVFKRNKRTGFALLRVPPSVVVGSGGGARIIDLQLLADAWERGDITDSGPATPVELGRPPSTWGVKKPLGPTLRVRSTPATSGPPTPESKETDAADDRSSPRMTPATEPPRAGDDADPPSGDDR